MTAIETARISYHAHLMDHDCRHRRCREAHHLWAAYMVAISNT